MKGKPLSALWTPALVVDVDKVKENAKRMIDRCQKLGVQLRPHMKTHKTLYARIWTHAYTPVQVLNMDTDMICVPLVSVQT